MTATPERRKVMIRSIDVELWIALRAEAIRRRWDTGAMLEEIIRFWLKEQKRAEAAERDLPF